MDVILRKLPNGLTLAAEKPSGVCSVSLGVWVGSGTRHEPESQNGISHFIEHMLFKGTQRFTAAELADKMDVLGGEVNAYTAKELTCFYARVLSEDLREAADMLAAMLCHSLFSDEGVSLERGVINEEIGMYEDNPEELATERLTIGCFGGTPLGPPILGTRSSIAEFTGEQLKAYQMQRFTGDAMVVSVAGGYSESDLDYIAECFSAAPSGPRVGSGGAEYHACSMPLVKKTEQSNIAIGFPALPFTDERRYALGLLNGIVGANMSSRLFQRVREQLGWCYSIYSFVSSHEDTGMLGIYLGTSPENEQRAMREIGTELAKLKSDGIGKDELEKVRRQVRSGLLMALESTSARQSHIGRNLLLRGEIPAPEAIAAKYAAVTAEDIVELARELITAENVSISTVSKKNNIKSNIAALTEYLR